MNKPMREVYGEYLAALGADHPEIIVLDADVSSSTKSRIFAQKFPERFFNTGVAEGNLAGVAAGLATCGYHPVINAFAVFLSLKSLDQIRNDICYNKLPVVIAGAYSGLSDSYDGASHQALEDIAIFRALPNMEVIVPSDASQVKSALDYAFARRNPVYIRLNRNEVPDLDIDNHGFSDTKAIVCREGKDVTIATTGIATSYAIEAADVLLEKGIEAEVICVPFIKPLDAQTIRQSINKTGVLLTVEESLLSGGFYSSIAEAMLAEGLNCRVGRIGMDDRFGETGSYPDLLDMVGISSRHIVDEVLKLLVSKH